MGLLNFLKSSILSKIVMALTGVLLVLFVIGHTLGNMQIFIGPEQFNHYALMLQSLGEILWIIRIVLFIAIILHIITSIRLQILNAGARPVGYKVKKYVKAKLTARTMFYTGLTIAAFVVYHLLHFTVGVTNPDHYDQHELYLDTKTYGVMPNEVAKVIEEEKINQGPGYSEDFMKLFPEEKQASVVKVRHDVYSMVVKSFRVPYISIVYIIGVVLLGFHLSHAVQSMFQTLGANGPRFTPWIMGLSNTLAVIIVLCLISIPITILAGLVGGAV